MERPKQFLQEDRKDREEDIQPRHFLQGDLPVKKIPDNGTTACFAIFATFLFKKQQRNSMLPDLPDLVKKRWFRCPSS